MCRVLDTSVSDEVQRRIGLEPALLLCDAEASELRAPDDTLRVRPRQLRDSEIREVLHAREGSSTPTP